MAVATRHAEGNYFDYTPDTAVAAGDVIDLGDLIGIAEVPIAAGVKGAIAVEGIFKVAKKGSPAETWTQGEKLYYDVGTLSFTDTSSYSEAVAGVAAAAAGSGDTVGYIKLTPGVSRA